MESNAALDVGREYDSQIINWSNQNVSTIEFQMHFSIFFGTQFLWELLGYI